jgi:hypothetical protein
VSIFQHGGRARTVPQYRAVPRIPGSARDLNYQSCGLIVSPPSDDRRETFNQFHRFAVSHFRDAVLRYQPGCAVLRSAFQPVTGRAARVHLDRPATASDSAKSQSAENESRSSGWRRRSVIRTPGRQGCARSSNRPRQAPIPLTVAVNPHELKRQRKERERAEEDKGQQTGPSIASISFQNSSVPAGSVRYSSGHKSLELLSRHKAQRGLYSRTFLPPRVGRGFARNPKNGWRM